MYPVSDAYKAAIAENVRTFRLGGQIKLKSGEVIPISDATVSDKEEIKIDTRAMSSDEDMSLGYCGSATLSMYIIDDNTSRSYGDAEITLTCGLEVEKDKFEDIPMGIFYVNANSVKRQRNMFKITAYDAMVKLQYALTETMRSQLNGKTAYQAAALLFNGNMAQTEDEVSAYPNGDLALDFSSTQIETARDAVMWCGHLMGCFTCIDRFGKLKFEQLQPRNVTWEGGYIYITPERTITANERFKTEFSETRLQIFKLIMRDKDNQPVFYSATPSSETNNALVSHETDQNPLVIGQSDRSVEDVLRNIVGDALHRMAIQPFKASVANDPALEVRDYIRIQNGGNVDIPSFHSMLTHSVWRYRGRQDLISSSSMQMVEIGEGTEIATVSAINDVNPIATEEKTYVQPRSQTEKRASNAGGGSGGVGKASAWDETSEYFNDYSNNVAGVQGQKYLYAHAEGKGNIASGEQSHAEGSGNTASGIDSHAEGSGNTASGGNSHAEGSKNTASGEWSHVEGYWNTAAGFYSHVEGLMNISGEEVQNTHIEGYRNTIKSVQNSGQIHIEGESNTLESGTNVHIEGSANRVNGTMDVHAEGSGNKISGSVSTHVQGRKNTVDNSDYSCVGGDQCNVSNTDASIVIGENLIVNGANSFDGKAIFGRYNVDAQDIVFAIGGGSAEMGRKNLLWLDRSGNLHISGQIFVDGT